jgi:threonine dehydrogenase-like Zn-dependent dehydrogenase
MARTGGLPGGQAEYVRVPFGEVNCLKVPKEVAGKSPSVMNRQMLTLPR